MHTLPPENPQIDLPKMEKMGFSPGWYVRLFLLVVAVVVWAMFIILPLLSAAAAEFHGVAVHGWVQNLTYALIGFNYIGGLYALHEVALTLPFLWVFTTLLALAFWY